MGGRDGIWNFAYGGNMNPRVLLERRRITPLESVPGFLEDYRLVFNTRGFPWIEPAFANVQHEPGARVHGVLHRLTEEQFARLDRYEWGGVAYRHLEVDVAAYDGRRIRARVYSARYVSREKSPSCRYLALIREGARLSGLDPDYVRMLELHSCRDTPAMSNSMIGVLERSARLRTLFMFLILGTWKVRALLSCFRGRSKLLVQGVESMDKRRKV